MADLKGADRGARISALQELAKKGRAALPALALVERVAAEKADDEVSTWAAGCIEIIDPSPQEAGKTLVRQLNERAPKGLLWMASSKDDALVAKALPVLAFRWVRIMSQLSGNDAMSSMFSGVTLSDPDVDRSVELMTVALKSANPHVRRESALALAILRLKADKIPAFHRSSRALGVATGDSDRLTRGFAKMVMEAGPDDETKEALKVLKERMNEYSATK